MNFAIIFALVASLAAATHGAVSMNSALRRSIFANYDKLVNPDQNVTVNIGLTVIGLQYCPVKEKLTANVYLRQVWTDPRLTWKKEEWNGIDRLRVPASEVWLPDITLYNSLSQVELASSGSPTGTSTVMVIQGMVIFIPHLTFNVACPANITGSDSNGDFFTREQECTMTVGSWTHDKSELDLVAHPFAMFGPFNFSYFFSKRIEMLDHSLKEVDKVYPPFPKVYPRVEFTVRFKNIKSGAPLRDMMMKRGCHGRHH